MLTVRRGFGLRGLEDLAAADGLTVEFKEQEDVEVLVLRQVTTKRTGFHTDRRRATEILAEGVAAMRLAIEGKAAER